MFTRFFSGKYFPMGLFYRLGGGGSSGRWPVVSRSKNKLNYSARFFVGKFRFLHDYMVLVFGFRSWILGGEMSAVRYQMSARKVSYLLFADFPLADI
jgi:hypothetical protein